MSHQIYILVEHRSIYNITEWSLHYQLGRQPILTEYILCVVLGVGNIPLFSEINLCCENGAVVCCFHCWSRPISERISSITTIFFIPQSRSSGSLSELPDRMTKYIRNINKSPICDNDLLEMSLETRYARIQTFQSRCNGINNSGSICKSVPVLILLRWFKIKDSLSLNHPHCISSLCTL